MGFSNEIKTILKLDDKDWKKALESIKQAEKSYYHEVRQNTEKLIQAKNDLLIAEQRQVELKAKSATTLKNINKDILKSEKDLARAKVSGDNQAIASTERRIKSREKAKQKILSIVNDEVVAQKRVIKEINNTIYAQEKTAGLLQKATPYYQRMGKEIDKTSNSIDSHAKSTENLANQTIRYLRWAGTIAGVLYAGKRAWDATLGTGIEVNKIIESNTMGIAALTSANTRMVDSLGNTLTPFEKFAMGQKVATKAVDDLRAASVKTYATFPQLLEIYQQAIGQTMSMGGAFGQTVDEVSANTIELSKTLSNIAGSIGMPMDRVREEIRSMLSGNASTDSLISTMLFGSPGEANKAIRDAKGRTNGVVDLLNDMMKDFKILETTRTYQKGILTLQDSWSRVMSGMVEKSGMFQDITDMFYNMSEGIVNNTDDIIGSFDAIYDGVKGYYNEVSGINSAVFTLFGELISGANNFQNTFSIIAGAISGSFSLISNSILLTTNAVIGVQSAINYFDMEKAEYEKWLKGAEKRVEDNRKLVKSIDDIWKDANKAGQATKNLLDSDFTSAKRVTLGIDTDDLKKEDLKTIYDGLLVTYKDYENEKLSLAKWYKEETYKIDPNLEYEALLKQKFASDKDYFEALEKLNAKTRINLAKQAGEKQASLLLTLGVDTKQLEQFKKDTESGEDKLLKLQEKKLEATKAISKYEEKIRIETEAKTLDEESRKILTDARAQSTQAELTYEKQINEEVDKRAKKQEEIERSQNKILREMWVAEQKLAGVEVKKSDNIMFEIEGLGRQYTLEKDRFKQFELYTAAVEKLVAYNKEIAADSEQERIILENRIRLTNDLNKSREIAGFEGELNSNAIQALETQRDLTTDIGEKNKLDNDILQAKKELLIKNLEVMQAYAEATGDTEGADRIALALAKIKEFGAGIGDSTSKLLELKQQLQQLEDLKIDIQITGFDDISNAIAKATNSFGNLWNNTAEYQKDMKKFAKDEDKQFQAKLKYQSAQIGNYADISSVMGSFYDEDDARRQKQEKITKALHAVQMGLQLTAFVTTMAQEMAKAQAAGTTATMFSLQAPPPMNFASLAAVVATIASFGVMLGGKGKTTTTSDAFSAMEANAGTGSVLGDSTAQSESIANSLGILEDLAKPEFRLMSEMAKSLESINAKTGGVSSLLLQQGGFAFGASSKTSGITGSKTSGITGSKTSGIIGGKTSGIIGDLFGKTSGRQTMTDSGIYFTNTLLQNAIEEFNGSAYQTMQTTVKKRSLLGSSTRVSYNSYFAALDDEVERQFSLVLSGLYETTLMAGEALDMSALEIENDLSDFVVSIGKISLKGKTGDQIQETLSAIFGKIADDMAKDVFPLLTSFQQVGEGFFETMTRVASGMEEAKYYIQRLGSAFEDISYTDIINTQGDVGFEALYQSIVKTDEALYGMDNNLVEIISTLNGTAAELFSTYVVLDELRYTLQLLNLSVQGISFSSIRGAGSVDELVSGMESFTENFLTESEKLNLSTSLMQKEFAKLNITMPESKDAFRDLVESIDLTTESGQEFYGRLIILSDSFSELTEEAEDFYSTSLDGIRNMSEAFSDMSDSITETIKKLLGNITGASAQDQMIQDFWSKRAEADVLLALDGDLTSAQQTELQGLIGDINQLSLSIQGASVGDNQQITNELVGQLNNLKAELDFDNQILNVNIVGIETSLGLVPANNVDMGVISSLPSFDVGTTNVSRDMIAQIHKNEIITPAPFAQGIRSGALTLGNNKDIITALNRLEVRLGKIEASTAKSANVLDEAQYEQRPILVKMEA